MTILLTGSTGQIGSELKKLLVKKRVPVVCPDSQFLDFKKPDALYEGVLNINPKLVINAAAYTDVDKAETEQKEAFLINAKSPGVLGEVTSNLGIPLIHYSTDYVFNGEEKMPYEEESKISPVNVYGQSKAEGERLVRLNNKKHFIFRTSWVYGLYGKNFFLTMQRLMKEKDQIFVIDDQFGAPTWSYHIALATLKIVDQLLAHNMDQQWGTYHLTNSGETSWFGFAQEIKETMNFDVLPILNPISSNSYGSVAKRPKNSRLSNKKLKEVFGIEMVDWKRAFHSISLISK